MICIVGGGRVGSALARIFEIRGISCFVVRADASAAISRNGNSQQLARHYALLIDQALAQAHVKVPVLVINTVAYTDVDSCEKNASIAYSINAKFPYLLFSRLSQIRSLNFHFIHLSTDMMFDSKTGASAVEDSVPCPKNVYAKSKFLADSLLSDLNGVSVVRGNFLFKSNSVGSISFLEYLERCDNLTFTASMFSPATLEFAASVFMRIFDNRLSGLFHVCSNRIEKADFVVSYLEYIGRHVDDLNINPQNPANQPVPRPLNMSLGTKFSWCFDVRPLKKQLEEVG